MSELAQESTKNDPPGTGHIRRVLTRWDLILFGLVILSPTAVYPVYGIIQNVSHGQAALSYIVAMLPCCLRPPVTEEWHRFILQRVLPIPTSSSLLVRRSAL